jgi:hypothetical protein
VQLTIYQWDTLSCNNPKCQLQVNLILTQWAVEYQAVMLLMESLRQEIFIPFGWILEMSENFSILILLLLDCLLNEQHLSLARAPTWTWEHGLTYYVNASSCPLN